MNYRVLANRHVAYEAALRNSEIDNIGVITKIRRTAVENEMSYYGDFISNYLPEDDITVVPQYNKYYQVIDVLGYCVEPELPLECLIKTYEYVPNGSIIKLGVRALTGGMQIRWWRVLSTEVKHVENVYARVAKLSPVREVIAVQATVNITAQTFVVAGNDP